MDPAKRHQVCWRLAYTLLHRPIERIFNLTHVDVEPEGPCLVIANHVTDYDPLLVAMSFPRTDLYFVASEHLFRKGLISRILLWAMSPIPRRKGSQGTDTVKACLRHLREGHSVCIFAEGDATWDGRSAKVFPATGKLARASGASLLTYRLEGGYLARPRWSRTIRHGRLFGHAVQLYSPEELKTMRAGDITASIDRDIWEDAWARQRKERVFYRGKRLAEQLELALFCCPRCGRFGTLHSRHDRLFCDCGLSLCFDVSGFFYSPEPFETIAEWEDWQQQALKDRTVTDGEAVFSDDDLILSLINSSHREKQVARGKLVLYPRELCINDYVFPLGQIDNMAMVQKRRLLFSFDGQYYELCSSASVNIRKYLSWWKISVGKKE